MRYSVLVSAALAFFVISPAFCGILTDADFDYLAAQSVAKSSPILRGLSPREQSRLHALINDPKTMNNPVARAKIIRDTLLEFEDNQHWERMNPGQLWDSPKRGISRRPTD